MAKKQLEDDLLTGGSLNADDKSAKKAAKAKKSAEKKAAKAAKNREKNEAKRAEIKEITSELDKIAGSKNMQKKTTVTTKKKLKSFPAKLRSSAKSILQ